MKKAQLTVFAMFWLSFSNAQILFTPSGLTGASTNSNVGIGTDAPQVKLEVKGTGDQWILVNHGNVGGLRIQSSNSDRVNVLYRELSTDFVTLRAGHDYGELKFIAGGANSERMRIDSDGNIGIGTKDPQSRLDVQSTQNGKSLRLLGDNLDLDFHIGHNGTSHGFYWRYKGTGSGNLNDLELWSNNQNGNDLMVYKVHQDGNIFFQQNLGIGTESLGSHQLAVEGSIGAREIKVEVGPNWSDFVFYDEYKLRTLEEVEQHINEKGYLPEIPSKEEVTENGINLGEMNAKLLQKIEELTLYLIEQNKQNQAQQGQLKAQSEMIEQLKNEVFSLKNK